MGTTPFGRRGVNIGKDFRSLRNEIKYDIIKKKKKGEKEKIISVKQGLFMG